MMSKDRSKPTDTAKITPQIHQLFFFDNISNVELNETTVKICMTVTELNKPIHTAMVILPIGVALDFSEKLLKTVKEDNGKEIASRLDSLKNRITSENRA